MVGLLQPLLHGIKILTAYLLLFGLQLHDRALKQEEMAAHTVVTLGRAELDELLRHINDIHAEILALLQIHYKISPTGYNQAVTCLEAERLSDALKSAIPIVTIGNGKVSRRTVSHRFSSACCQ